MSPRQPAPARPLTLCVDVGGTDLKVLVLDRAGDPVGAALRQPIARPPLPRAVLEQLQRMTADLPAADRVSVGFPGVIHEGRIGTAVNLCEEWVGVRLDRVWQRRLGLPVRVANDADVQGLGAVRGRGVELVVTLGTGFGSGLFVDGVLVPNLELGHHCFRRSRTYEQCLGLAALRRVGEERWNALLREAIEHLRRVFNFRRLYLGGGNARLVRRPLPPQVSRVSNRAGLLGGLKLWSDVDAAAE